MMQATSSIANVIFVSFDFLFSATLFRMFFFYLQTFGFTLLVPLLLLLEPPRLLALLEVAVLEREFRLLALTPARLVVKVHIRALCDTPMRVRLNEHDEKEEKEERERRWWMTHLLVVVGDLLGLLVSLEPREVLLVVPPELLLQLTRRKIPVGQERNTQRGSAGRKAGRA